METMVCPIAKIVNKSHHAGEGEVLFIRHELIKFSFIAYVLKAKFKS